MYERTYGYLYDASRPAKDDAASIRRTVKTLTKAELLPADWTYSVRYRSFAGGCSIDVKATSPRPLYSADPEPYGDHVKHAETGEWVHAWKDRLSIEAKAVLDTLEDLQNGHNHDGSDVMTDYFDVKFYGTVHLETVAGVPRFIEQASAQ